MVVWRFLSGIGIPAMRRDFMLKMMPKGAICAEIGVYAGDFSEHILKITQPKELHLIDPWAFSGDAAHQGAEFGTGTMIDQKKLDGLYASVMSRFDPYIKNGTVVVHRAKSEEAAGMFADRYFDWAYIDGDHLYEAAKRDLEIFHTKVKQGGMIAVDDYGSSTNYWKKGVTKAVDEFIAEGKGKRVMVKRKQFVLENL